MLSRHEEGKTKKNNASIEETSSIKKDEPKRRHIGLSGDCVWDEKSQTFVHTLRERFSIWDEKSKAWVETIGEKYSVT